MRLKSVVETVLRGAPPLYRFGSRMYHKFNPEFKTLSPGAPGAIQKAFEFAQTDQDAKQFKGDYHEFGVFRGGTFLAAYQTVEQLGLRDVSLFGYDSFEGLPPAEGVDAVDTRFFEGQFACSRSEVEANLAEHGVDLNRATFVEGFYEDTLSEDLRTRHAFQPASVVLLDCDYYSSTKVALDWLTPLLQPGTVVLFDDWYSYGDVDDLGQPKAFADWLLEHDRFKSEDFCEFEHNGRGFVLRRS